RFLMEVDPIDDEIGKDQAIHVYRIVQEGINNILKHAGASEASVLIRVEKDNLRITISDNGKGIPQDSPDIPDGRHGFGLVGISERAKVMNGTMTMESTPNKGTTLIVLIPRLRKTT
ncbi:MAG: ATP-binding protein, partial [Bacteroidota bacterium]